MEKCEIEKYDFIKHELFMDVAVEVEFTPLDMGDHFMVTGYWWNQAFEKSFMCPVYEKRRFRPLCKLVSRPQDANIQDQES